ncbi:hypothetical protein Tsubulata_015304 [Turnera subulata]|uniref:COPII coat assembly protein SEC16 n=1 Tax=Turnera subulata TaxID=218843 RepID=A0A9Q0FTA8_9ROSI|nr:hypothetical protein Tsubulata_015304 [Turnera subulata]
MKGPETPPPSTIRRRNSIAASVVIPPKPIFHTSSLPPPHTASADFELFPLYSPSRSNSSPYTSIKDLLPSPVGAFVNSPTAAPTPRSSSHDISIRNRLVKQAAWAYLQPMSSPSSSSSGDHFLRRLWLQLSSHNPVSACIRFFTLRVAPAVNAALDRFIRFVRVGVKR